MSVKLIYDRIRKRDGRIVEFDAERITLAVNKALKAVGTGNEKLAKT
ncbi:MAG: ATP cone domain-containing protein, partial [Lentisphaerae bacterium]|nr:ATP cone domain-containing protein [Lentisphaerota bacterium]